MPLKIFIAIFFVGFSVHAAGDLLQNVNPSTKISVPGKTYQDSPIVIIPFEYKQSALYHLFTLRVMDSVIDILLKDTAVKLSIEGYTHADEGNDTISYYLSLNRALFIRDYVLGRGIDSSRIISVKGLGKLRPLYHGANKKGIIRNCRAEVRLNYPPPPPKINLADKDEDGIADAADECPEVYGKNDLHGCPDKNAVIIPFEAQLSALTAAGYKVLDSVVNLLKQSPSLTIAIEGHAYKTECTRTVCNELSKDRADIVKNYLLSRYIPSSRIISVKNFGSIQPLNAGKDPREILRNARAEIIMINH